MPLDEPFLFSFSFDGRKKNSEIDKREAIVCHLEAFHFAPP
jgi:hypothetical protein